MEEGGGGGGWEKEGEYNVGGREEKRRGEGGWS